MSSVEAMVVEGEALAGRRRSARCLGKERPCYALSKKFENEESPQKRPKPKSVKREQKGPSKTNGFVMQNDAASVSGKEEVMENENLSEVRENGISSEVKENGISGNGWFNANESKVSAASEQLNNGVHGQAPTKSAKQRVKETLRMFNTYYLQFVQEEEKRVKEVGQKLSECSKNKNGSNSEGDLKRASKRPDLKASSKMIKNNQVLYPEKMIGDLPGISVGDQFLSRCEMVVLGLHSHWLNGIDYIGKSCSKMEQYRGYTLPLAVCIVLSGMYEDDQDNSEDVVYTGQGGHDLLGNKRQVKDQKLERGNLALQNNHDTGVPVRVVRGHESRSSYCGKVYTYDGLYKVVKTWAEKGAAGFTVYKYRLKRITGQPSLTTNQVRFTREQAPQKISELRGLVCEDISGGQENMQIPASNVVDDPPFAPTDFEYSKAIRLAKNLKLPTNAAGCKCKGECGDPRICSCAKLNGGDFPYVRKDGGRLIEAKSVVFECGPSCGCNASCVNRTSQKGLKYRLEVFRTANKGWAVRSWDTIPSGAPVCEYTGILRRTDEVDADLENNYIFDIDCLQTMKGLDGRERRPGDTAALVNFDDKKAEADFCLDAGRVGNVARFINHSCEPNLFVQCVLSSHNDIRMAKVMLFAADTILPLQELCYDYGYALDSVVRPDGSIVQLACHCGAAGCRKRLY
ncbi:uncharacterized protein A4U43_C10F4210 [Asparagus officinalis]|uniref:Histone-lysine N-methyltransferase n=1 Tax=Asparagus officinalis TaxID=4686 RepID=A0A5P1E0U5_ASPOF|nr:histone-lysine N-methyltransferase, H3 lysine-9 specific SUVH4 [Asparagus officinalis]ONK56108.1 uncharacterized protein A4U43_C10F4210 [Asparagus officinalis]